MILLRATANSQPLICSMGSVSTVVVSWYQTSCKISSASASLPTRWRMKPSSRLPNRLTTDAIFFPGDEVIRGWMVNMSSILTRKTGEWGEYFKKGKKIQVNEWITYVTTPQTENSAPERSTSMA